MFWKKDPYEAQAVKDQLMREAQKKQQMLGQEITKTQIKITTFEETMNRKLRTAVNKALFAKNSGDKAAMKNAYIDIRMAMRFKALAGGMSSAMTRLASNLDFATIAEDMSRTLESAGELTKQNPSINISKLDGLYQKAMGPLNNIVEQMTHFAEFNAADPNDELSITDEDVERIIQQVAGGGAVATPQPYVFEQAQPVQAQPVQAAPAQADAGTSSVDAMISELGELAKKLSV